MKSFTNSQCYVSLFTVKETYRFYNITLCITIKIKKLKKQ